MSLPDLTKLNEMTEQELIATMPPLVSIFLHGTIKRPVGDVGQIQLSCGWCEEKTAYHNTTPEGWSLVGKSPCCPACAPNVLPEPTDE